MNRTSQNLKKLRLTKKYYYDKTAKNLPDLQQWDIVRMKTKNGYKKLAIVQRANDTPRSYVVQSGNREYRPKCHDLLQSKELPGNMHNEHFLEDYISLAKREESQENKLGSLEISTHPSETPVTVNQSPVKPDIHRDRNINTTSTNTLLCKYKLCFSKFAVDINNWQNNPAISCMKSV